MKTTKTKTTEPSKIATQAAQEYLNRKDRTTHPDGKKDNGGRWYPLPNEGPCSKSVQRHSQGNQPSTERNVMNYKNKIEVMVDTIGPIAILELVVEVCLHRSELIPDNQTAKDWRKAASDIEQTARILKRHKGLTTNHQTTPN